ncbi:hypothetical protein THASP1DRAFT_30597 [Thamnocephalis sphaerospora]|uniref:F-box domain-containing protein n=1 Tax=Thamnocephalis sphaerospora TaxID=78915 RepID=A0A4P9XNP9_9FUNG|nr:hypothetical protein THASP1DRAFT_30597 [Thamnocephalis sphaerospora]|eukprot:RKP07588.1 hypothetical protein THASP1DRAFT_30597 [Thamnocephalis sphaerospora]
MTSYRLPPPPPPPPEHEIALEPEAASSSTRKRPRDSDDEGTIDADSYEVEYDYDDDEYAEPIAPAPEKTSVANGRAQVQNIPRQERVDSCKARRVDEAVSLGQPQRIHTLQSCVLTALARQPACALYDSLCQLPHHLLEQLLAQLTPLQLLVLRQISDTRIAAASDTLPASADGDNVCDTADTRCQAVIAQSDSAAMSIASMVDVDLAHRLAICWDTWKMEAQLTRFWREHAVLIGWVLTALESLPEGQAMLDHTSLTEVARILRRLDTPHAAADATSGEQEQHLNDNDDGQDADMTLWHRWNQPGAVPSFATSSLDKRHVASDSSHGKLSAHPPILHLLGCILARIGTLVLMADAPVPHYDRVLPWLHHVHTVRIQRFGMSLADRSDMLAAFCAMTRHRAAARHYTFACCRFSNDVCMRSLDMLLFAPPQNLMAHPLLPMTDDSDGESEGEGTDAHTLSLSFCSCDFVACPPSSQMKTSVTPMRLSATPAVACGQVHALTIDSCDFKDNRTLLYLLHAMDLRVCHQLVLQCVELSDAAWRAVATLLAGGRLSSLKLADLEFETSDAFDQLVAALPAATRLAHLELSRLALGPGMASKLSRVLARCASLQRVSVTACDPDGTSAPALLRAFAALPALRDLSFVDHYLGMPDATPALLALIEHAGLSHLCINFPMQRSLAIVSALFAGLHRTRTLQQLELTSCRIDDALVDVLATTIRTHALPTLQAVSLYGNRITVAGARNLSAALSASSNRRLTLHLDHNHVAPKTVAQLANPQLVATAWQPHNSGRLADGFDEL